MKYLFLSLLTAFLVSQANAKIDTTTVESDINAVTVFFSGAEVKREAKLKLSKGKHFLLIDHLPDIINPQSIQVEGLKNVTILSVKHERKSNNAVYKSSDVKTIEEKIKLLKIEIKRLKSKINVLQTEEKILMQNSTLGGKDEGVKIEELKNAAVYYRERLNSIRNEIIDLGLTINDKGDEIEKHFKNINRIITKEKQSYSQILIAVEADQPLSETMTISYYVPTAGWTPTYDFRVKDINEPLTIIYNANVYQTSGEDWNKVDITLSSNDPSLSGHKPELQRWILGEKPTILNKAEPTYNHEQAFGNVSAVKGVVSAEGSNEPMPFTNVVLLSNGEQVQGTTTDFDGKYILKPIEAGRYEIQVSYVGYQTKKVTGVQVYEGKNTIKNISLTEGVALSEVEVVEYSQSLAVQSARDIAKRAGNGVYSRDDGNYRGSRSKGESSYIDGLKMSKSKNLIDNTLSENTLSIEYSIKIPYSIPSTGKDYTLKIKETKVPVDYEYFIVPRVEKDAFLVAHLSDWESLNLLSGKSSLYFQGKFTGESYINANQTEDTLQISLGRDKSIFVSRERNKEINDKQFYSNNIKETVAWDIVVKNNKNYPVKVTVEDQYPITNRNSIDVDLLNTDNAKVEEKSGFLSWTFEIPKAAKKEISFSYEAKYPKYMSVQFY